MEEVHHHIGPGIKEVFGLINILIVIAIIYFGGRKGIRGSLLLRSETMAKKLTEAKSELQKIRQDMDRAHAEVSEMEKTKRRMVEEVEEEGRKMAGALVTDAKKTAARILQDAKLAVENEVRLAGFELRQKLVNEALAQSAEMVKPGNEAQSKIHTHLFDNFLTELPAAFASKGKGVGDGA